MLPELGNFAMILALSFCLLQGIIPMLGLVTRQVHLLNLSKNFALGQCCFLLLALSILITCFINNDFTVIYIAQHSNIQLPLLYRIGATWGAHEGSVLLWCTLLSLWSLSMVFFKSRLNPITHSRVLMVLAWINSGFLLFLVAMSNPFNRIFPTAPIKTKELSPILQDPGLIFHPPILYAGYVGFAISFALAIVALIEGRLNNAWIKACRPWVLLSWCLLTVGIVLGSWWAYRELGWGGWWFWDPVENAALLPWLAATALLHSLAVCEKRQTFKGWVVLLAMSSFILSLLGTFLIRSGVLVSVHAFATDPKRGIYLFSYLTIVLAASLILYAIRAPRLYQPHQFSLFSKETLLLLNSIFLLVMVATILLGTLYPIILDGLNLEKISVGADYFNSVFLPITLPMLILMGIAPHCRWQQYSIKLLMNKLKISFFMSMLIALCLPLLIKTTFHFTAMLGSFLSAWILCSTLKSAHQFQQQSHGISSRQWAMLIAHSGIALLIAGIACNKAYSQTQQIKIHPGETTNLGIYQFTFMNVTENTGPNYQKITAHFAVFSHHHPITILSPAKKIYNTNHIITTETAIAVNWWRDLYIALGTPLPDHDWSVRLYFSPFVRWIWAGGILIAIGGLLAICPIQFDCRLCNRLLHPRY